MCDRSIGLLQLDCLGVIKITRNPVGFWSVEWEGGNSSLLIQFPSSSDLVLLGCCQVANGFQQENLLDTECKFCWPAHQQVACSCLTLAAGVNHDWIELTWKESKLPQGFWKNVTFLCADWCLACKMAHTVLKVLHVLECVSCCSNYETSVSCTGYTDLRVELSMRDSLIHLKNSPGLLGTEDKIHTSMNTW